MKTVTLDSFIGKRVEYNFSEVKIKDTNLSIRNCERTKNFIIKTPTGMVSVQEKFDAVRRIRQELGSGVV
jgi:hypothetical protein